MLMSGAVQRSDFGFVPLPIDQPERIVDFIRTDITCFTTICDDWNLHKIRVLEKLGFKVISLIDRRQQPKSEIITGSHIRDRVLAKDDVWKRYIPQGALQVLEGIDFANRLRRLA